MPLVSTFEFILFYGTFGENVQSLVLLIFTHSLKSDWPILVHFHWFLVHLHSCQRRAAQKAPLGTLDEVLITMIIININK